MPDGKPAGVACIQLNESGLCKLFGKPERPQVCGALNANLEMCGKNQTEARIYLANLERLTGPIQK
jgi:hypothetical protein